jgi:hypothetical protein
MSYPFVIYDESGSGAILTDKTPLKSVYSHQTRRFGESRLIDENRSLSYKPATNCPRCPG